MKLTIVVRSLTPYTASFFDALAESAPAGDLVTVITGKSGAEWVNPWEGDVLRVQKATLLVSPFKVGKLGRETVWPTGDLWIQLSRQNPTHLLVQEYSPYCALAVLWAKINRRPVFVATDIGPDYGPWYPALSRTQLCVHRFVDFIVDGIVALTVSAQKKAAARHRPCLLAPHAIDTRVYLPFTGTIKPKSRVRILHVGNLIERKGIDLLLQGFAGAISEGADIELRLIGGGDALAYIALSRELGVADRVTFVEFMDRSSLIKEYQQADIFCLATRADTYAVVVHEAAACGLPLVISKHAGAAEVLVQDGENGLIVDPENIRELSGALHLLATDQGKRGVFSVASRETAERWDCISNAKRLLTWVSGAQKPLISDRDFT